MPTSGFDLYHMQDAKNNFDAMRPAPMYNETNQFMGQCHNVHVSTNCYYGYDGAKRTTDMQSIQNEVDCEMPEITELPCPALPTEKTSSPNNARKRSADDEAYPQKKRLKEEVQRKRNIEPETYENLGLDANTQELLENLYWHIHGGNFYQLL
ncbi:uncharacterized protein [Epargyreus clarus]|uniref:uncharacterized protein isoform X2 n=1 Tax=Epargyreus clarus TaxID=520877 RepID=UPI003C2FD554